MDKIFTTQHDDETNDGAIDLMAKMGVLIVAGLLFAGYGIREGRSQTVESADGQATAQGRSERVAMQRRFGTDRQKSSPATPGRAAPQVDGM